MKELPKKLRDTEPGNREGFKVVANIMVPSYPSGLFHMVIEVPEGEFAGFWMSSYTMEEDWTDMGQCMTWKRAKKIQVEKWEFEEWAGKISWMKDTSECCRGSDPTLFTVLIAPGA